MTTANLQTKICCRCGQESEVSVIGTALVWFVCDLCRGDNGLLHMGHDTTIEDMVYQLTENHKGDINTNDNKMKDLRYIKLIPDTKHKGHPGHTICGGYCWTCQRSLVAGVPGWPRPSKGIKGSSNPKARRSVWLQSTNGVTWADGTQDNGRTCALCHSSICSIPVHNETYKIRNKKQGE